MRERREGGRKEGETPRCWPTTACGAERAMTAHGGASARAQRCLARAEERARRRQRAVRAPGNPAGQCSTLAPWQDSLCILQLISLKWLNDCARCPSMHFRVEFIRVSVTSRGLVRNDDDGKAKAVDQGSLRVVNTSASAQTAVRSAARRSTYPGELSPCKEHITGFAFSLKDLVAP